MLSALWFLWLVSKKPHHATLSKKARNHSLVSKKPHQMRLYFWFAINITSFLPLSAMLDGGSISELATRLKYDDLANLLKQEPILSHIFLLVVSSLISTTLLVGYYRYQFSKNWFITKCGVTGFKVVHLTLFSFLPILFFGPFLGQPWPIIAKIYLYLFSWLSLSYDQKVFVGAFVGAVMMGFLPVISVIVGRQVREKPAKEFGSLWWLWYLGFFWPFA